MEKEKELSLYSENFVLLLIGNEAKSNMFELFYPKRTEEIEFAMSLLREELPGTVGPFPHLGEP